MPDRAKPHRTPTPQSGTTPVPGKRGPEAASSPTGTPHTSDLPTLAVPSPDSTLPSLIGQTFGNFELTQELGRGGMGVVYKAWQKNLQRPVALKLLLPEHANNPQVRARFHREALAAASLAHPNIVSVYDVGESTAGPYFVMEFIDGPSLEELLVRTLPVAWTVTLLITVAEAVQHAHDKGIIHRDLKPANVMLHQQKRPVVMDFGIARVPDKGSGLTLKGTLMGTPAYMPPEQAGEEPGKIGPHSDVYSLGAILYTLLTGKVPFEEETALKTIMLVLSKPPQAVRHLRPDVPARLEQICMKCLEKDPKNRYATAQALAEDLKRVRASLSGQGSDMRKRQAALPEVRLIARGGKAVRLSGPATVIGRAQECDLVLKSADVSKRHCRIVVQPDQVIVEDLASSNGTFVNGEQIDRVKLADGDELEIAGHIFRVRVVEPGAK
jgi:serine/threonine protein kinase